MEMKEKENQIGCGYCQHEKYCNIRDSKTNKAKQGCKDWEHWEKANISDCYGHSLFVPKDKSFDLIGGRLPTCPDCENYQQCLSNPDNGEDKYKVGRDVLWRDGSEYIKGKIIEFDGNNGFVKEDYFLNGRIDTIKQDFFLIQLEKPDSRDCTIILQKKTFSPYNLTAL